MMEQLLRTPFRGKPWDQFLKERAALVGMWLITVPVFMAVEFLSCGGVLFSLFYFLIGLKVFAFGLTLQLWVDGLVGWLDRYRQSTGTPCG